MAGAALGPTGHVPVPPLVPCQHCQEGCHFFELGTPVAPFAHFTHATCRLIFSASQGGWAPPHGSGRRGVGDLNRFTEKEAIPHSNKKGWSGLFSALRVETLDGRIIGRS
jgi:hypothetical protein